MQDVQLLKYPRTHHLQGSRLQPGDEDLSQIPFSLIAGKTIVVEEKIDGANTAVSFSPSGELLLQSRGHYLTSGYRERHYNLMKLWANVHRDAFREVLGSRYIMYGEWMYAKHTVYYDRLPHYFLEFDIWDREEGCFLDTHRRHELIRSLPVASVPVLAERSFRSLEELLELMGHSNYISQEPFTALRADCEKLGLDAERAIRETDPTGRMEGLYIKVERNGQVVDRMKFVRSGFYQKVQESDSHWLERPIIPNHLAISHEDLFAPRLPGKE